MPDTVGTNLRHCRDCQQSITHLADKAIGTGEFQIVWTDPNGDWICAVTGDEHSPATMPDPYVYPTYPDTFPHTYWPRHDTNETCRECGSGARDDRHVCQWCRELFDDDICPNAKDICTNCCGED